MADAQFIAACAALGFVYGQSWPSRILWTAAIVLGLLVATDVIGIASACNEGRCGW